MSSLKSIGQLIRVPIEQVELTEEYDIPAYYVGVLAEKLKDAEVRNWVPVIVQEQALREFRVVENGHILDAMRAAGQEYVWVVVIPDDPHIEEQVSLLMGKSSLKVNLCTASYEAILSGLNHLIANPAHKLNSLPITLVTERILQDSSRFAWTSLQPLTKLGLKSITTAKLKVFAEVFEAKPEPIEIRPVILNTASASELLAALYAATTLPEVKLGNVDLQQLAKVIAADPNRQYWTDLTPLTKLKAGITKAKLAGLDQVFQLNPAPAPEPNTVPYLLNLMTQKELKSEAKRRDIAVPKNANKTDLVELLSSSFS